MISPVFVNDSWQFRVWAPEKHELTLHIVAPFEKTVAMQKHDDGYFTAQVNTSEKELSYFLQPNEKDLPDPASLYQPRGVHGPSQTYDHEQFKWTDENWKGVQVQELIIYELHTGLFTPAGTFEAIIPRLKELKALGVNAIELMPVAQFPGERNWGYDGVYPCAIQNSYGGPEGLKKLVDACHQNNMAVILDVVYNHLGPEGDYFSQYGPYFTDAYRTPWGDAINFDGAWSDGVRDYFCANIIQWFRDFHVDGLRCDAIHAVFDYGAVHFWELVQEQVAALLAKTKRNLFLIAESDLNSPRVLKTAAAGGYGFDAQWLDDFHHALNVLVNPSDHSRYYDFGTIEQLAKAYNEGFVHSGQWVQFRKKKFGRSSAGIPGSRFVVFSQNHDQVGNRADGKRLSALVSFERAKLAAAAVLLAPYIPMLFMGEEYAEDAPFFYFVDHSDEELIKAVQEGRRNEFRELGFEGDIPDPQETATFLRSKLEWQKRNTGRHKQMLEWYKALLRLRKSLACFNEFDKASVRASVFNKNGLSLFRQTADGEQEVMCVFNFGVNKIDFPMPGKSSWEKLLDSGEAKWNLSNTPANEYPPVLAAGEMISLHPATVVIYRRS